MQIVVNNYNPLLKLDASSLKTQVKAILQELRKLEESEPCKKIRSMIKEGHSINLQECDKYSRLFSFGLTNDGFKFINFSGKRSKLTEKLLIKLILTEPRLDEQFRKLEKLAKSNGINNLTCLPIIKLLPNSDLSSNNLIQDRSLSTDKITVNQIESAHIPAEYPQKLTVYSAGIEYKEAEFKGADYIVDHKDSCRALAAEISELGIKQPKWISTNFNENSFTIRYFNTADIISQFIQGEDLLLPNSFYLGKFHFSRNGQALSVRTDTFDVYKTERINSSSLNELLDILSRTKIAFVDKNNETNDDSFFEKALALEDNIYLKPAFGLQGKGIMKVQRNNDDSYTLLTDSGTAREAIIKQHKETGLGSISLFQRIKGVLLSVKEFFHSSISEEVFGKFREIRADLKVNFNNRIDLINYLKSFNMERFYFAEAEIPIARIKGERVEFRFLFNKDYDSEIFNMTGHYAKISGALVTGNIAGGGHGCETIKALKKLCHEYNLNEPQKQLEKILDTVQRFTTKSFDHLEQIENINYSQTRNWKPNVPFDIFTLDCVLVFNDKTKDFDLYIMEAAASKRHGRMKPGLQGLKVSNQLLYAASR